MAKSKDSGSFDSEDIQAQIELTIRQLIQLTLFQLGKQYNLPLGKSSFSKVDQTLKGPIDTDFYSLEVNCDYHQVYLELLIKTVGINDIIATHKLREPKWAFLAFIKEEPITLDDMENDKEFWKKSEIYTQSNGKFRRKLKPATPYYALFLVAFEDSNRLVLEGDEATMLELPPIPSIDHISVLEKHLKKLVFASRETDDNKGTDFDKQLKEIQSRYIQIRESLAQTEKDELRLESMMERININEQNEILDLVDRYKK